MITATTSTWIGREIIGLATELPIPNRNPVGGFQCLTKIKKRKVNDFLLNKKGDSTHDFLFAKNISTFTIIFLESDCCEKLIVNVTESDQRIQDIEGEYHMFTVFNGFQSFKHNSKNYFLFYVNKNQTSAGKGRWVIEDLLGKLKTPSGGEYLGLISHEGNQTCPSGVGRKWHQLWNHTSIDTGIRVHCLGKGIFKIITAHCNF